MLFIILWLINEKYVFKIFLYNNQLGFFMTKTTGDNKIFSLLAAHENWRTQECLNLLPSENMSSPAVRQLLASDLGNRYTLNVNSEIHGVYIKNAYGGTKYTDSIETEAEEIVKDVHNAKFCTLKPLSGHIAGMIMLVSLCEAGDLIMAIHEKDGGYDGYMQDYMPNMFNLRVDYLPFNQNNWNVDSVAAAQEIRNKKPKLVILGASFILFPYDIKPIRAACDEVGSYLGYDASHVLGLMAGGGFQDPFKDGVDIVTGSTHKSLFGPQGGLILSNSDDVFEKVSGKLSWYTLDNAHQNRIAGLGQTYLEMQEFGYDYAGQVVKNSKSLALALAGVGLKPKFGNLDYSESHQVLLDLDRIKSDLGLNSMEMMNILESENIIIDCVGRLGTNEMTRRGCKESDMQKIAEFISRVVIKHEKSVSNEVKEFVGRCRMEYCF
jgi:glycine hydroxymethyltransferase